MTPSPDPALLDSASCAICGRPHDDPTFAASYVTMVCEQCDERAVNRDSETPRWESMYDHGDNPVFIDGRQCWRRYKFGGYITLRDRWDSPDIATFYDNMLQARDA